MDNERIEMLLDIWKKRLVISRATSYSYMDDMECGIAYGREVELDECILELEAVLKGEGR